MSDLAERQTVAVILDIAQRAAECSGDLTSLWIERETLCGVAHVRLKTDIVDVLMPEKAFDIITGRAALAPRLEALERIKEALEAEAQALDRKCSALSVAHGPLSCGCSYDRPEDICAAHSPQLMAARARLEALEKAAAALAWRPLATAPKPKLGETWSPLFMVGRDGWPESVALARYNTALDGGHVLEIFYPNGVRRHEDAPFTHWRPVDYPPAGDLRALARAAGEGETK